MYWEISADFSELGGSSSERRKVIQVTLNNSNTDISKHGRPLIKL